MWTALLVMFVLLVLAIGVAIPVLLLEQERRIERVARERQRIAHDAIRVKSVLDQEAFRSARAMHDVARRSRR